MLIIVSLKGTLRFSGLAMVLYQFFVLNYIVLSAEDCSWSSWDSAFISPVNDAHNDFYKTGFKNSPVPTCTFKRSFLGVMIHRVHIQY